MADVATDALDRVLRPRSVAVVGASRDPTKRGNRAVRALLASGYQGRVLPIHPDGRELHGVPVYRGPGDLDAPPDLVLVCTPVATVPGVLETWAEAGAAGAVVLAVGFAESGAEGARVERAVTEIARRTGLRVVGPNTSGILNVPLGLNLIGLDGVRAGPLALLVQSGNMALSLVTEGGRAGAGFSFVIGVGNEADLTFDAYLDFLARDPDTRGVAIHAEGFRDGRAFLGALARASERMPVVVLKGGRTARGGEAARSHTGAVSGSYDAFRAGVRQAGAVEVRRTDEVLPTLMALVQAADSARGALKAPGAPGDSRAGLAVLSDGGGHATLAVDDLHDRGVPLATLSAVTRDALRALLGPAAAVSNPVDLAGAADRQPEVFARAFDLLASDPGVGAVLVAGLFGGYAIRFDPSLGDAEAEAARAIVARSLALRLPVVVHSLYASRDTPALEALRGEGLPVVESLEVACRAAGAAVARRVGTGRHAPSGWPGPTRRSSPPREAFASALTAARAAGRAALLEPEIRALTEGYGVPLVPATLCTSPGEAAEAARAIGGPVALRVVAEAVPHKTEAGGVALGVAPVDAGAAFDVLMARVHEWIEEHAGSGGRATLGVPGDRRGGTGDVEIAGVMVAPMLARPTVEVLVGVRQDEQFGPVLTVGAGGTGVEVLQDVTLRVLPVDEREIDGMLDELRLAPLLGGYRGAPAVDRPALVRAIAALARCALDTPELAEIEVNPLFADPGGAVAVDVRAFLTPHTFSSDSDPSEP